MNLSKKKCPACGYEWVLRTPEPVRCPACQHNFLADKRRALMKEMQAQEDDAVDVGGAKFDE